MLLGHESQAAGLGAALRHGVCGWWRRLASHRGTAPGRAGAGSCRRAGARRPISSRPAVPAVTRRRSAVVVTRWRVGGKACAVGAHRCRPTPATPLPPGQQSCPVVGGALGGHGAEGACPRLGGAGPLAATPCDRRRCVAQRPVSESLQQRTPGVSFGLVVRSQPSKPG
jgi:hypothetical protein